MAPRTDKHATPMEGYADTWIPRYVAEELERELYAAIAALKACREDATELLSERSWWKYENRAGYRTRYDETAENIAAADEILTQYEH